MHRLSKAERTAESVVRAELQMRLIIAAAEDAVQTMAGAPTMTELVMLSARMRRAELRVSAVAAAPPGHFLRGQPVDP